jgi:hypothetical protein
MVYKEGGYDFKDDVKDVVPHKHGLSRRDMQDAFDRAGLTMKSFEDVPPPTEHKDEDLFLAIGEKPSA